MESSLIKIVKDKIKQKEIKISRVFKLKSSFPNGIELIKETLKKVNDFSKKENFNCKILYAGAPNYRISLTAQNYKDAEKGMDGMIEIAEKEIKGKGTFEISKK